MKPLQRPWWIAVCVACWAGIAGADQPFVSPVEFVTEDGFRLHGDLTSAADAEAPVAILLHMYQSDRSAWAPLVPALVQAGFTVLALDQRAHGESTRRGDDTVRVGEIPRSKFGSWVKAGVHDVAAARAFLDSRGLATDRLVLIGASYGCSVSLLASSDVPGVVALVLLSPGTSYFGVDVLPSAKEFEGALFAVAAEDDLQAARSARSIHDENAGRAKKLLVYLGGGHGTRLFGSVPQLGAAIADFLKTTALPSG